MADEKEWFVGGYVLEFAEGDPEEQQLVCGPRAECLRVMGTFPPFDYVGPRRLVRVRVGVARLEVARG